MEANRDTNEKTARTLLKNAKAVRNSITSCWCKKTSGFTVKQLAEATDNESEMDSGECFYKVEGVSEICEALGLVK